MSGSLQLVFSYSAGCGPWLGLHDPIERLEEARVVRNLRVEDHGFGGEYPGADGTIELFVGPSVPAGAEDRWIQTEPGSGVFVYFRIYGPEAAGLDGSWKLDDLVAT
jgi:hypothetical protein